MDTSPAAMQRLRLVCLVCLLACAVLPAPAGAAQTVPQDKGFDRLFGYEALPAGTQELPIHIRKHWLRTLSIEQKKPCLQRDTSCLPQADAPSWLYLAKKASSMEEMELLRTVNAFCNKFPAADAENYGPSDHWPVPADLFNRRAGDAKVYALAKYFALRALGVQDDKLRIVLAHLPERKAVHAMLAVATAKGVFILDNAVRPIDLLLPAANYIPRYVPLLMLNEKGRWHFNQDLTPLGAAK